MKYLIVATLLAFTGCADDGDPGPKGDKGDAGEAGAQGEQGPEGEPGAVNVLYSDWMDLDWNVADETDFKQMAIEEPAITEAYLDEGGILLVFLKGSSPEVTATTSQLPLSNDSERMYFSTIVLDEPHPLLPIQNGFFLNLLSDDGSPVSDYQEVAGVINYDFRYILIPGGMPLSSSGRMSPPVDFRDYDAVKAYYNISD